MERLRYAIDTFMMNHFGGHKTIKMFNHEITFFGWNAMHFAIQTKLKNGLYLCFRPPSFCHFRFNGWYLYLSPDGTPQSAVWLKFQKAGWDYRRFEHR